MNSTEGYRGWTNLRKWGICHGHSHSDRGLAAGYLRPLASVRCALAAI